MKQYNRFTYLKRFIFLFGPSMIWSGRGAKKKDKSFQVSEPNYTWINWPIFQVTEPYLEPLLKINERLRLIIENDPKVE